MKLVLLFTVLLSGSAFAMPALRPFATDGCTLSPDGTYRNPKLWRDCCVAHDLRLWGGGTTEERDYADEELYSCVKEKAGATVARIFLTGVRIGTYSPYKIPAKAWGNAWYKRAGYRTLSEWELDMLLDELVRIDVPEDIRETYRLELEARRPTL